MFKSVIRNLDFPKLHDLLKSVFALRDREQALTFLVDLPDGKLHDNAQWADRRRIAAEWYTILSENSKRLPFSTIMLCTYPNVGTNNNELPQSITLAADTAGEGGWFPGETVLLESMLRASSVVLAPTELSATAPLKNLAKQFDFRGATLPGFSREMIPALALDYEKIHARVMQLTSRLDRATSARVCFQVEGTQHVLLLDLRYRGAHASGGLMRENGIVANLPSGEAYIVPYEGERSNDTSHTAGTLPVQFEDEIVLFRVEGNKAVEVTSSGKASELEREKLLAEPAYGNIAELGLGVLGEWGVNAVGSILLDEKLGLHIAFGRSEHFGGITAPTSFRNAKNVIHLDFVYVPSSQPRIEVEDVVLMYTEGQSETIMVKGKYTV